MTSSQTTADNIYMRIGQMFAVDPLKDKNIIVQLKPPRMNIKFNRPKRYNAFTIDMYMSLSQSIKKAQKMDDIKFIVISGEGGNFSSGNDLANFTNPLVLQLGEFTEVVKASSKFLKEVTLTLIKSSKPIIALTEGKVVGFTFTMLPLLDKIFAVQNSYFTAPLVSSAQGPELCASFTFPKIFGKHITQELITFGKPVNADFLAKFNFVQKCTSKEQAQQKLSAYLDKINQLQWQSYINARRLYKQRQEQTLVQVAQRQVQNLIQRWMNPQFLTYIGKHMLKMKKAAKL